MSTAAEQLADAFRREGRAEALAELIALLQDKLAAARAEPVQSAPPPPPQAEGGYVLRSDIPPPRKRNPKGANRQAVLEMIRLFGGVQTATEIQRRLAKSPNPLAYSSVRHALGQLTEKGVLVEINTGSWMLKEEKAASQALAQETAA